MAYTFDPNKLCETMMKFYTSQRMDNVDGKWVGRKREINRKMVEDSALCCYILNEGSSRSSKTYDFWHFMFWLCGLEYYRKNPLNIFVYRTTLKACRETAYDTDFVNCMKIIGHYSPKNARNEGQAPEYNLFGSIIKFRGLENGVEQGASDVIFFNEALDNQDPKIVDELLLRCTKLAVFDWNPKLTYHFLFDWEGRERTLFTKTTILDNKHRPEAVLERLMSYSPWDFKDFDFENKVWKVPESERSVNEKNFKYNTVNRRMFLVYFMGERCPEEGIIFPNVEYVPEFPDDCEETTFGLDFGYACLDGNTIVNTLYGDKKISEIKVGDYVLTDEKYSPVINLLKKGKAEIVEMLFEFDFGYKKICCTLDHNFKTANGWKQLKDLTKGEMLYLSANTMENCLEDTQMVNTQTTSTQLTKKEYFIEKFGGLITEKYQLANQYIILMAIRLITILTTLCLLVNLNMQRYIMSLRVMCAKMDSQKKTGRIGERLLKKIFQKKLESASGVKKNTLLRMFIKDFALRNVIINGSIKALNATSAIFVKFAEVLSKGTNILNKKLALQNAHTNYQEIKELKIIRTYSDDVYDITISNEKCFFANGILVHNCDPSVLVKVGKRGMDLFIEYQTYAPCETAMHLYYMVQPILDAYQEKQKEKYGKLDVPALNIVCDSSDKYKDEAFVEMLNLYKYKDSKNYDFYKTSKKEIVLGISLMKMFRLHVVWRDNNEIFKKARMEFENYTNDKVNGMYINRPIDKFNHGIDATRYVCVEKYLHLVNR